MSLATLEASIESFILEHVSVPAVEKEIITILVNKLAAKNSPETRTIITDIKTAVDDAYNALPPITVEA